MVVIRTLGAAMRSVRRSPRFAASAVAVLALAIGANTAIFSVMEGVLFRPLPYRDSARLVELWKSVPERNIDWDWTSYPTIRDWQAQSTVFEQIAAVLHPEGSLMTLHGRDGSEKLQTSMVSANFFQVLGVAPLLGTTFSPTDNTGDPVVLSYGFWQQRFGGEPQALGRTLRLDDRVATIVGVMPPDFQFPNKQAQLWTLINRDSRWPDFLTIRFADAFSGLARLKPGVSMEQVRAEMNAIAARLSERYHETDAGLGVSVVPLFNQITGAQLRRALWLLGGAVFLVLLIACSNVAGLLVARGAARRTELAVRATLGASRARLVWQLASENLVLCLAGGVGGLFLASAFLPALVAFAPANLPRADGIGINRTVLAATFGLSMLTGVVFGLLPAFHATRRHRLHYAARGTSEGPGGARARGLLVAAQFALTMVLLTGAGLLIRSFLLLNAVDPGYDPTHLLTLTAEIPDAMWADQARSRHFLEESAVRIETLPGVRGATWGGAVLDSFQGNVPNMGIVVEGRIGAADPVRHGRMIVTDNYFRVLGIPLVAGRLFSADDRPGGPTAGVINEAMARRFWGDANPIGQRFRQGMPGMNLPWVTVVGVVRNAIYNRDGHAAPLFYLSARQHPPRLPELVVRTWGDPLALVSSVRTALRSVEPAIPEFHISTAEQQLSEQERPRRFQTGLVAAFAGAALLLAALGLYALAAYSVEQRRREIGIRMALGAGSAGVVRLVVEEGLGWVLGGAGVGIVGSLAAGRLLAQLPQFES